MFPWLQKGVQILPLVIGAVHAVEMLSVTLRGKDKQDAAINTLMVMLAATEGLVGRDLMDDQRFRAALRSLIDAYVSIQNLIAGNRVPPSQTGALLPPTPPPSDLI